MIFAPLLLLAAQDVPVDCAKAVAQTDMNQCAYRAYQKADRAMNAQWRVTLAAMRRWDRSTAKDGLGPPPAQLLLASQRAWLAYRDAQCRIEGQYARGGTMQPMLESSCMETLTIRRTEELQELITD